MSKITFCLFIFVFKLLSMCITGWLFPEITLFSWQQEDSTLKIIFISCVSDHFCACITQWLPYPSPKIIIDHIGIFYVEITFFNI